MRPVERVNNEIKINITTKQKDFLDCKCDDVLYGGSAGGGKTYALLLFAAMRRMSIPNSRGIIFRRTYPEIERSLVPKSREIFSHFGAKYNQTKHAWEFPGNSIQEFGHAESEADVYNYQSAEYQDMCFDELTHFSQFQFAYLTSRVRSSIAGIQTLIRSATNPGGVGHAWVFDRYVKPWGLQKIWTDKKTKKTMTFIPSKVTDNPYLMEADPDYLNRLRELPEKKYQALAEGRLDVFEGAYFTEWDPNLHILRRPRKPDSWTYKFLALDWGFAEPASVGWYEVTPLGRVFRYRGLYTTRRSPKELARDILEMSPENEEYMYMRASPEIWGKRVETEDGGEPIQALMQTEFGDRIRMEKANNARVPGWLKCREYLSLAPDGYPWFQVSPTCLDFIDTVPKLIHEDRPGRNSEDVRPDGDDHCADEFRYAVTSLKEVPKSPMSPYASDYEKIFGVPQDLTEGHPYPTNPSRSGYGL